jgi:hypothetical protein
MTYVLPDKTVVYGPGDFFFESGDVAHTAQNKTDAPMLASSSPMSCVYSANGQPRRAPLQRTSTPAS